MPFYPRRRRAMRRRRAPRRRAGLMRRALRKALNVSQVFTETVKAQANPS